MAIAARINGNTTQMSRKPMITIRAVDTMAVPKLAIPRYWDPLILRGTKIVKLTIKIIENMFGPPGKF